MNSIRRMDGLGGELNAQLKNDEQNVICIYIVHI